MNKLILAWVFSLLSFPEHCQASVWWKAQEIWCRSLILEDCRAKTCIFSRTELQLQYYTHTLWHSLQDALHVKTKRNFSTGFFWVKAEIDTPPHRGVSMLCLLMPSPNKSNPLTQEYNSLELYSKHLYLITHFLGWIEVIYFPRF